ncbi:MAG: heavy metal-responsive transcriptional regulator [gamma proteobacterium symbiont of Bathyaustriella thionipta]|nr:heavy metal-responsive transcriptional regulator [gamma proteobacterium symbiont of Bathyaustriella thionipta]MCU7949737.1 heavy metal-responsive transcriptional regulator [gamma proteobacterium symbiont of Bathyaustriella thionipta]MCU7952851.1 heavy metal-responsive transcriptional regulator [gamma proteobacterium symbiont of Bathyaustriella thionipta]MCU7956319.1 heavy metal-responsive transcriptional regulator [gamma proteobacterium symbiont of Bathyaustriella thionipta]MCU7968469.1 heav
MLNIGQVAKETGITVETIRFYEKQGLIDTPQRTENGYRQYPQNTVKRVRFIQHAKDVGFTLKNIGELLSLRQEPGTSCTDIKLRTTEKIEEVDQKIRDLTRIREALARMVMKCTGSNEIRQCPILEELEL